ncbi:hypothetical protein KK2020170_00170 [Flavobacterium okayamense]|uniref:Uncharacterized protein n=1 Tax=Flavobacterium okayamense TaxID=2830782 RepID=A0ABN6HR15_9FLAO|nr:hypothetical protein KK2020170_00170 [Flavobacterium okayamense]
MAWCLFVKDKYVNVPKRLESINVKMMYLYIFDKTDYFLNKNTINESTNAI